MPIPFDGLTACFLLWVFLVMPVLAVAGYIRVRRGRPLRSKLYRFRLGALFTILTGALAVAAADSSHIHLSFEFSRVSVFYGLLFAVPMIAAVARAQKRTPTSPAMAEHRKRMRLVYAPETAAEWKWAVIAGLAAGVGEEIAYRGVLYQLMLRFTASAAVSVVICVTFFAIAHLTQGRRGVLGIAYMALCFHLLVFLSGGLMAPMIVHTTYDVAVFTIMYRREKRLAREQSLVAADSAEATPASSRPI